MTPNIKEKVLKDKVLRNKIQKYINFPDKESRDELDKMLAELFHQGKVQKLAEVGTILKNIKIIKDEFCICGCSKKSHQPHQLDKNGGRCGICVNCPIYTWKSFEFVDLKEVNEKLGIK